jgi:hypothetical protein
MPDASKTMTSYDPPGPTAHDSSSRHKLRAGFGFATAVTVPLAAVMLIAITFAGPVHSGSKVNPAHVSVGGGSSSTTRDVTLSNSNPLPPNNPSENLSPNPNFYNYCTDSIVDLSSSCQAAALEAINHGRASEGLAPLVLPTNWAQLSSAEQLFAVTNLERTARRLAPFSGMSSVLDFVAAGAANADTDARPPSSFPASYWTSNWAGGVGSPLEAIYLWMYDDGPGSPNVECPNAGAPGCWGHRDDILAPFSCSPCVMGVAVAHTAYEGEPSWAELMVDTTGSPALDFSWSSVELASSTTVVGMSATAYEGYWIATAGGVVHSFGGAPSFASANLPVGEIVVGISATPDGQGYWLVTSNGNVLQFGTAVSYGNALTVHLSAPIVGMAPTNDGGGYWLVASDGGIFSFGDAAFHGSTGAIRLNRPVVGMAATSDSNGYWLVASDGGIFSFGDAVFHGSTGAMRLNRPVVGMTPTPGGGGYWLVASDGGIFSFGNASFHGSTGNLHLDAPVVGMDSPTGNGYWLVASDGGIFSFGVPFHGSMA